MSEEPDEGGQIEIEQTEQLEVEEALRKVMKDDADGLITPAAVVEAAKDPASPLHRYFQWDDSEAAKRYREQQARQLIRTVRVRIHEEPVRRYVNVVVKTHGGSNRQGYVVRERATDDPELYEQIVTKLREEMERRRSQLAAFEQARPLVDGLAELIEKTRQPDKSKKTDSTEDGA